MDKPVAERLIAALEANTKAQGRVADSLDSLAASASDLAIIIESAVDEDMGDSPLLDDFFVSGK